MNQDGQWPQGPPPWQNSWVGTHEAGSWGAQQQQPAQHMYGFQPHHQLDAWSQHPARPWSFQHGQSQQQATQPRDRQQHHNKGRHHGGRGRGGRHGHPRPDLNLGFADAASRVKYDEAPPRAPALIPVPSKSASDAAATWGSSGQQARLDTEPPQEGSAADRANLPILLFDLNGTLTSHTAQRRSTGVTRIRPGVAQLAQLAHKFRIGIYSSATHRTVAEARGLLEQAAGTALFEPGLILHRDHAREAPASHMEAGGKKWDTEKPLSLWFKHVHRILLLDDDEHKSVFEERGNLVLVPKWEEEDPECPVLAELAAALEQELCALGPDEDVRLRAAAISARLHAVAKQRAAQRAAEGAVTAGLAGAVTAGAADVAMEAGAAEAGAADVTGQQEGI